jgi:hypothetical protein
VRRSWRWLVLGWSVALIAAATLLPLEATTSRQLPPHWCIACGGAWAADAVSNIALFTPLGLALALCRFGAPIATLLGGVLSLAVELSQSAGVPPGRSPSIADLLTNTAGTMAGWLVLRHAARLIWASGAKATKLAAIWWTAALAVLVLAAGAEHGDTPRGAVRFTASRFEYSPGYGWYGGSPISATVSTTGGQPAWTLPHRGTGPIVAQSSSPSDSWQVSLETADRDSATSRRAILYVHTVKDSTAELVIAQHDRDAELLVRRRAADWGLVFPVLPLRVAFDAPTSRDTVRLHASATGKRIVLTKDSPSGRREVALDLSPALGWTMLQTLVGVEHPLAPLIAALWLGVLFLPIAWWATRSGRALASAVSAIGLSFAAFGLGPMLKVAPFSARDAVLTLLVWAVGTMGAKRTLGATQPPPG